MRLSVIIPCLNESTNLSQLLPYLDRHTDAITEIIVVDAANSSDNSSTICQRNNIKYLKSTCDQRAQQLNLGAKNAKGDRLCFVHADVRPPLDFVSQIHETIDSGYDFGLFAYRFDKDNWLLRTNAYFTKSKGFFCGGGDQCHFLSKKLFEELGGYNTSYPIMEDFDLYSRVLQAKKKITVINSRALVSARKYKHFSYLRINIVNLLALSYFKLGGEPAKIKRFCQRWLRP